MNTDKAWEKWGKDDPYYGVFTDEQFRMKNWTENAKQLFFESGEQYIHQMMATIKQYISPDFSPASALDFGCGTGRLLLPLAKRCTSVVGLDISPSMLAEAQKNLADYDHTSLLQSDDGLTAIQNNRFDLVHTFIVLQHIPPERVLVIFTQLVKAVKAGGVGVLHFTYAKTKFSSNYGIPPTDFFYRLKQLLVDGKKQLERLVFSNQEPAMQMNMHSINQLYYILQISGVEQVYTQFTNHEGALGTVVYFKK